MTWGGGGGESGISYLCMLWLVLTHLALNWLKSRPIADSSGITAANQATMASLLGLRIYAQNNKSTSKKKEYSRNNRWVFWE